MFYITGDKHGDFGSIKFWARDNSISSEDTLAIVGDCGINFHGPESDRQKKRFLDKKIPCDIFAIRGNHDQRPEQALANSERHYEACYGGRVLVEDEFPSIKYAKDGEIYFIEGYQTLVAGGAWSIDGAYRRANGWPWFHNEQLSHKEMYEIYETYINNRVDIILSHTAPSSFKKYFQDMLLQGFDDELDNTMEDWFDSLYESSANTIIRQYFGHFHADRDCGPQGTMLFNKFIRIGDKVGD